MAVSVNGVKFDPERLVCVIESLVIVYEDETVVVIDKPAGLLAQPGKTVNDSAETRVRKHIDNPTGPVLVHRRDMDTSGLMVFARNRDAHRHLQQQFEHREVAKRYVAEVVGSPQGMGGFIALPLCSDYARRPRQRVCWQQGKPSETAWRVLATRKLDPLLGAPLATRVEFLPRTGRTHQLRVHAAHREGLHAPIIGDRLYGAEFDRLHLHASVLAFRHPRSGEMLRFSSVPEF